MLRLFQSIFGGARAEPGRYPEELVERAIERAVDATDPRLRTVRGHRRRLRPAVLASVDHVVDLVNGLPDRVDASRAAFDADPRLAHFFASARRLPEVFGNDPALRDYLKTSSGRRGAAVLALLAMQREQRTVLGMQQSGDGVRREVLQKIVDFSGHRLIDPAADEEDARRALMRRAYDHLLSRALRDVLAGRAQRTGLERERVLMQRKLESLRAGNWGLDAPGPGPEVDAAGLEARIAEIAADLERIGPRTGVLERELEVVEAALARPRERLWHARESVTVDREGVLHDEEGGGAHAVPLDVVHDDEGQSMVVLPVAVPLAEVPPQVDGLAQARRVLG